MDFPLHADWQVSFAGSDADTAAAPLDVAPILEVDPRKELSSWPISGTMARFAMDALSAGSDTGGGYFYIDWNGKVSPCVFMPYSPININDAYRDGKTLNEVWQDPFFASLRNWQKSYKQKDGNWLMPCPIRDHHADLRKMIAEYEPEPSDESAREALLISIMQMVWTATIESTTPYQT